MVKGGVLITLAPTLSDQRLNQGQEQKLDITKGTTGNYPSFRFSRRCSIGPKNVQSATEHCVNHPGSSL